VEKQPEEVQLVVGDYPVQVQLGMIEEEHQEIQPQEDIEEDLEEVIFEDDGLEEQPQLYDVALLEVDADGDIVIPSAVGEAPEPDVADEDEPVQDAAGNDPYDSGDDSSCSKDNSSDEEDEEEEDEDFDIEGMEEDNSVVANNENNNDNQDDGNIIAMRMRVNRVMSIGTAEQNTMSTLILVQMVCFVSCWRS
jgi:hypothetical protein